MSSICSANIPMETNPELMQENWGWVDQRLKEMYHGYGLVSDNFDDYIASGLLVEMSSWVDNDLQNQYSSEFEDRYPCPAPVCWVFYKDLDSQHCLEEKEEVCRSRAESDISDHFDEVERVLKRLNCQSPLPTGMYPYYNVYADEVESMISLETDDGVDDCSTITNCSFW
jgi:hypothetical protein